MYLYMCTREDYVVAAISQKISGAPELERERELVGGNALRPPRTRKECPTGKPRDQELTIAFNALAALRPTDEKSKR
jgi:hypothetical protein